MLSWDAMSCRAMRVMRTCTVLDALSPNGCQIRQKTDCCHGKARLDYEHGAQISSLKLYWVSRDG